jgi:hypothetical protein
VKTVDDLEALRFCTIVSGSLTIEINDDAADFKAVQHIEEIKGRTTDFLDF